MSRSIIMLAAMAGSSLTSAASADILVSNLDMSSGVPAYTSTIDQTYNPIYASQFVTGGDESVVQSATAKLDNATGFGLATYEAYIYAHDGVSPGSLVATFDTTPTIADGAGAAAVTFESTLGIELDANTTYWFGVYNTTGRYTGWETTDSNAEMSTAGWTIDDDAVYHYEHGTNGWHWQDLVFLYGGNVFTYSLDGNVVPAPGSLALLAAGGVITSRRRRG